MPATIETASMHHLDRLYIIEKECFKAEAFTKHQIGRILLDYNTITLIAKENDEVIGFVIGSIHVKRNSVAGHILTINVSPAHRRKGIGLKLLKELEKLLSEKGAGTCYLEVREDNITALKLYEKMNYKKIGRLEKYYGKAHGLYLRKDLAQPQ